MSVSEALDPTVADDAAHYILVSAGNDGLFGTSDDVSIAVDPAYVPGATSVSLTLPAGTLADGTYRLTLHGLDDVAGNPLASDFVRTFIVRASAPNAPVLSGLDDDTGVLGDGITKDGRFEVFGTAAAGSTVTLYQSGSTTPLGTGTADQTTGRFDITLGQALADGAHAIVATATDPVSGKTSAASNALQVTVDTTQPNVVSVTGLPADGTRL